MLPRVRNSFVADFNFQFIKFCIYFVRFRVPDFQFAKFCIYFVMFRIPDFQFSIFNFQFAKFCILHFAFNFTLLSEQLCKLVGGLKVIVATLAHKALDLVNVVSPARGGKVRTARASHIKARLQVVNDEYL